VRLTGFQGRTFVAVIGVSVVALAVAGGLTLAALRAQLLKAIERSLVAQTRLAAALLAERIEAGGPAIEPDAEADRVGALTHARVTLIGPDGRVIGDSIEPPSALSALDNHRTRPEVVQALQHGVGVSRRHSTTLGTDLMYAAVPVHERQIAVVRLALPLTDADEQVAAVGRSLALALLAALACAIGLGWLSSQVLARRVSAIAQVATRYASGDFSVPVPKHGQDELGTVARTLDDTARELGRRMVELAEDRARMEAILAGMSEGVLVCNAEGHILLANDSARRLLRAPDLTAGQHHLEVLRQPDVGALLSAALSGQPTDGLEFSPPRDPNRSIVARASAVTASGTRGVVLVLHDISDLRHADRVRRDFVANVSHELRTPLTAIQGYVEALLDDDPPDEAEGRRFLEIIDRHAKRMERLVRDLLRLARLEAGQEPVARVAFTTDAVFAEVITELEPSIDTRRQQVTTRIGPDAADLVSDPGKLHDVLKNLLENAVAYAPAGTRIELAAMREGHSVVLTVSDEGPGIPEADLARIFERFYRVDKARSRESGGTGLGLSIVKHLVSLLGGEVTAANRPNGGAVFSVRLPRG
jgi:two-component system, OmpR family, phosphate regulon sensor histidine kinase PhoR